MRMKKKTSVVAYPRNEIYEEIQDVCSKKQITSLLHVMQHMDKFLLEINVFFNH